MGKRLTTEEFIEKAREIYGDKYDYSKVNYLNNYTNVEIICTKHGSFWQTPKVHLKGSTCPKCAKNNRKLTTDSFIAKAKEVHGDTYDYSNIEYIDAKTKVEIICPEHGSFFQAPYVHLQGHGCPKCANILIASKNTFTKFDFIKKASKVHGDKYDYSNVKYINSKTKVEIVCPIHGSFCQEPASHLQGNGCPSCAGSLKLTNEDFIQRAREVHGDKYDYSKVNYINNHTKVEIICPIHGSFFQKPMDHLKGNGCRKCSGKILKTNQEFVMQANAIHNNKYDYSRVNYINTHTKVEIICPQHGSFWQTPSAHLGQKHGCPICAGRFQYTTEVFTKLAKEVHGNKYNYSKVEYVDSQTKVEIICPRHGSFFQRSAMHLSGHGCPKCNHNQSPQEYRIRELLENYQLIYEHNEVIDKRYPFQVDIYIPERDLFLEYNGYWVHGSEWCDLRTKIPKSRVAKWQNSSGPQYKKAIETYTNRDVIKRKSAKKNNLNYITLWDEQDIDKWFELGCPDGHDYDYEYSWIENDEERSEWLKNKVKYL